MLLIDSGKMQRSQNTSKMVFQQIVAELVSWYRFYYSLQQFTSCQVYALVVPSNKFALSVSDDQLEERVYVGNLCIVVFDWVLAFEYQVVWQYFVV